MTALAQALLDLADRAGARADAVGPGPHAAWWARAHAALLLAAEEAERPTWQPRPADGDPFNEAVARVAREVAARREAMCARAWMLTAPDHRHLLAIIEEARPQWTHAVGVSSDWSANTVRLSVEADPPTLACLLPGVTLEEPNP